VNHTTNNSKRNPCCHNGGDCPGGDFFRLTLTSLGRIFDGSRACTVERLSIAILATSKFLGGGWWWNRGSVKSAGSHMKADWLQSPGLRNGTHRTESGQFISISSPARLFVLLDLTELDKARHIIQKPHLGIGFSLHVSRVRSISPYINLPSAAQLKHEKTSILTLERSNSLSHYPKTSLYLK